jgi:single-strand DNA-binding protein
MAGVNKVTLLGNLGKDPDVKYMENGRAKATFTLATSEMYKNKENERITQTEWHNVVLWGGVAEIAEKYLKKGYQVYIEGKLTHRSYTDKEGNQKYITEVVGREMVLLNNRRDGEAAAAELNESKVVEHTAKKDEDDDLPF